MIMNGLLSVCCCVECVVRKHGHGVVSWNFDKVIVIMLLINLSLFCGYKTQGICLDSEQIGLKTSMKSERT
jgi:hypothetical protein